LVPDGFSISPFSDVTIADTNSGQTETVTVTPSSAAIFTQESSLGGNYNATTGVYTDTGSAAEVTAALDGLEFLPNTMLVPPQGVTTIFTIEDTDTAGASATDNTTTVILINPPTYQVVNVSGGGSYFYTYNPFPSSALDIPSFALESIAQYIGANATGTRISTIVDNRDGTSYEYAYNPTSTVTQTIQSWSATNASTGAPGGNLLADVVNFTNGTTYVYAYNPTSTVKQTAELWSTTNLDRSAAGSPIADVVNNTDGTTLVYAYDPQSGVAQTTTNWSATNPDGSAAGTKTAAVVDNANGTAAVYDYNPTSTVAETATQYSAVNVGGSHVSEVVDNTNGTSLVYAYNPTATVTLTAQEWSGTNAANGAPAGNEISDVVDNANGTSILYAYNPSSTVSETASYYSGATPTTGAPTGTLTSEIADYTNDESAITTFISNDTSSTTYYSEPDGTGSVIGGPFPGPFEPDPPAPETSRKVSSAATGVVSTTATSLQAEAPSDGSVITVAGSDQFIDPGTGNHTIQFIAGATANKLVLHLGGLDQVLDFDPAVGDALDLNSLLSEARVSLGDISQLSNYVSVANLNGSAEILFDPSGQGGGSQVALLVNDGGLVPQLQTLLLAQHYS
jgi:hypothetical protein